METSKNEKEMIASNEKVIGFFCQDTSGVKNNVRFERKQIIEQINKARARKRMMTIEKRRQQL